MTNMDDFRFNDDDSGDEFDDLFGGNAAPRGREIGASSTGNSAANAKFLGMSAGERAFLSAMLFFNVLVLGILLLIVTGRIAI